jgi:hypothetical protein
MERNILYRELFGRSPRAALDAETLYPPPMLVYEQETVLPLPAVHLTKAKLVSRHHDFGRPFKLNEPGQPEIRDPATAVADPAYLLKIVDWLNVAKSARYKIISGSTYCNIYAYDFCCFAGAFYPRVWWRNTAQMPTAEQVRKPVYEKDVTELNANSIFSWFTKWGAGFGWQELSVNAGHTLDIVQQLANQGNIVTLAYLKKGGIGHVLMVVPESPRMQAHRTSGKVVTPVHSQAGAKNFLLATTSGLPRLFDAWNQGVDHVKIYVRRLKGGGLIDGIMDGIGNILTNTNKPPTSSSSGNTGSNKTGGARADAVEKNRYYAQTLGWQQYYEQVNDLVLPYSGQSNVSLDEASLAGAVYNWQKANGLSADGIIGPNTWKKMQRLLGNQTPVAAPASVSPAGSVPAPAGVRFAQKKLGWAAYGGGNIATRLRNLRSQGKLSSTDFEIEVIRLVSVSESGQNVNAINSWDSAFMSMGFIQFTLKFHKLQKVIAMAPAAFAKHGIELDGGRKYTAGGESFLAIKGAAMAGDIRSLDWAKRFYNAGLEDDVIVAQVQLFKQVLAGIISKNDKQGYLNRFAGQHANLWAFIYEAHNSRPAILNIALQRSIATARQNGVTSAKDFAQLLIPTLKTETRAYYTRNGHDETRVLEELAKVGRIVKNTGI